MEPKGSGITIGTFRGGGCGDGQGRKAVRRGGRVDRVGRRRLFTNERLQPKVFRDSVRSRMAQKGRYWTCRSVSGFMCLSVI